MNQNCTAMQALNRSLFANRRIYLAISCATLIGFSFSSSAHANDSEIAELKRMVSQMQQRIEHLEKNQKTAKVDKGDIEITMNPSPEFRTKDGQYSFRPFGKLQADYGAFHDDKTNHPDDADFRRARLGFTGKVAGDWQYTAEFDVAGSTATANNVSVTYTGIEDVALRVGHFTPAFILEETTDDANTAFIERSGASGVFATGEIFGVALHTGGEDWTFNTGIHGDKANSDSSTTDDEQWSSITRATIAPINDDEKLLHLGAGASYRSPKGSNVTFATAAENTIQTSNTISASLTDVDDYWVYNLEAAAGYGSLSLQGEYMMADINRSGSSNSDFSGWYTQASYFLTGERRNYANGQFHAVKPLSPFSIKEGGLGAIELTARYSMTDLNDGLITGGEMENYIAGVNWYPNSYLRFMLNYIETNTDNNAVVADDDPSLVLVRSQIVF